HDFAGLSYVVGLRRSRRSGERWREPLPVALPDPADGRGNRARFDPGRQRRFEHGNGRTLGLSKTGRRYPRIHEPGDLEAGRGWTQGMEAQRLCIPQTWTSIPVFRGVRLARSKPQLRGANGLDRSDASADAAE